MTSVGDILRSERQKRNLELGQVANELKISVRFLQAIEDENFQKLPGGVFTRSFVRQYAEFLGLDGQELAAQVQRAMEPEAPTPQAGDRAKPDVPAVRMAVDDGWHSIGDGRTSWSSSVLAIGLVVLMMLVCSGVYWWWQQRPRRTATVSENTAPARQTAPAPQSAPPLPQPASTAAPENEPAPPAQASPADAGAPAAAQPAANNAPATGAETHTPAANPSNPNATVRVGITADESTWVRATVNGKLAFEDTMQPHQVRNVDGDGTVEVRLGNAGGVTITLNGSAIGPVGPKGQIRNVQFTSGGFHIVPPKPPDAPDDRR